MTLIEFLLERIKDDAAAAGACEEWGECFTCETHVRYSTGRVLAECEAKRRIVDDWGDALSVTAKHGTVHFGDAVLRLLAMPYAGHPDYDVLLDGETLSDFVRLAVSRAVQLRMEGPS